jgi:hypothetical protein
MITLTCSNKDCRSVFGVKDEHAGKKARCPKCRAVIDIPPLGKVGSGAGVRPAGQSAASVQDRGSPKPKRRDDRDREDDDDDRRSRRRSRDDNDDDYDDRPRKKSAALNDRDEDDDDDRPAKKNIKLRTGPPDIRTGVFLGVAAFLVLFAGINTFLPVSYVHVSMSASIAGQSVSSSETRGIGSLTDIGFEGILIFVFALLLFFAVVAAIVLLYVLERKLVDRILLIVCSVATGLSLWYVRWMLSLYWLYFRMLGHMSDAGKMLGMSISIWPGPGTILPLFLGLGAAACFAVILMQRRQLTWLGIAAGGGFFLGLVFLAADAQPWANPPFLGAQMKSSSSLGPTGPGIFGP